VKIYNYISILISLIFVVVGILILGNTFSTSYFFRNNEVMRYSFGALLIIYGAFRAYSSINKLKHKDENDEQNRYRL
jgi:uncharacterized membrane protein HdeD (DUF308 family)